MAKLLLLSHKISVATPSYAGGPRLRISPLKQISKGDSSNSYILELPNHLGTHVDAPRHFDPEGRSIADYDITSLIFTKPVLLDIPKDESQLIYSDDIRRYRMIIKDADMLLIRTGFQRFRSSDPEKYSMHGPALSSDAARFIADELPSVRALGIDTISISSPDHREDGRLAHRILLKGRDFLIVEDMDLSALNESPRKIIIVPLFIEGIDSSPCVVIAEV